MAGSSDDARLGQLERRVKADPASVAFAALAEEYRRAGRYQEAVDVSRTGLVRHPVYVSARVTLGRALLELGALDEARQEFESVLRTAPENLAAIRGLAEIHHRRGEAPEAADHYQAALDAAEQLGASSGAHPAVEQVAAGLGTQPAGRPEPALAGLERFLGAILAARTAAEQAGR